jgi:hypothetical protein
MGNEGRVTPGEKAATQLSGWRPPHFGNGNTNITSEGFGQTFSGGGGRSMLFRARIDF